MTGEAFSSRLRPMACVVCAVLLCGFAKGDSLVTSPQSGAFFVATDGDDRWSGTLPARNETGTDGPFVSLERARDAVRESDPSLDRRVVLRGGTYFLPEPLALGPEDAGSAEHPVVYGAWPGERVVLSSGRPITGWRERGGGLWAAPLPAEADARQLRVGDEMATLARHPNAVPEEPTTGGWLFSRRRDVEATRGWTTTVANIHTPGDWMEWDLEIAADGEYAVWMYYGQDMKPFGRENMDEATVMQVDGGADVALVNLPNTGNWDVFRWSRVASVQLTAGKHRLRWTNRKGGGINFNAYALCTDGDWQPAGTDLPAAAEGEQLLVVQAEARQRAKGREMTVQSTGQEQGKADELPFGEDEIPANWDLTGGQVMVFPAWGWVGGPVQIGGVDHDRGIITLTGPNAQQDIRSGNRFYLQNVREALDTPGEFYHDRAAEEILYLPRDPAFAEGDCVAPVHDRIIHFRGDGDAWPQHIELRGLVFSDTRYSTEVRSLYEPDDAAIWLEHARDITVRDCTFSHLGGHAVKLLAQTTRCEVLGCAMFDLGQGGVIAVGDNATQATNCSIVGCHMHHLGTVYKHVAGVYITTGSGHRVAHCTITDVPRYGISFKSYNAEAASHGNIAEYNEILRSNLETNDTGAIETLGRDRVPSGNVIRCNLILDVVGMKHKDEGGLISPFYTWGIYLDDYSSGTTVQGNIVARTVRGGYHNHLGFGNVVENNVFVDGQLYQAEYNGSSEMRHNVFARNIVVYSGDEAVYLRASGWDRAVLDECDRNVVWWRGHDLAAGPAAVTPEGPWTKWLEAGFDTNSVIADPQFANPANDDYRLRPTSPALKLGFEPIPVEKIGVRGYGGTEQ